MDRARVVRLNRRRWKAHVISSWRASNAAKLRQRAIEGLAGRLPKQKTGKRGYRPIAAPADLNLRDAYTATIEFLRLVRRLSTSMLGKFYIDFTTLETLTPAAALLLVAEFDRWREMVPGKALRPIDLDHWRPEVRNMLFHMGFFELMRTKEPVTPVETEMHDGERYLPFYSGHASEGDKAQLLRRGIEDLGPKLRQKQLLYQGLTEAMTNVKHHAYEPLHPVKRWWMSASVDATGRRLRVMFVDHGMSIPVVLPQRKMERLRRVAESILPLPDLLKSDAKLIQAAVELNRSGTGQEHRGFGLNQDIQGYIENLDARGKLRILSGRGRYIYEKAPGEAGVVSTEALTERFGGTFIEWIIEDYAAGDDDEQHHD